MAVVFALKDCQQLARGQTMQPYKNLIEIDNWWYQLKLTRDRNDVALWDLKGIDKLLHKLYKITAMRQ